MAARSASTGASLLSHFTTTSGATAGGSDGPGRAQRGSVRSTSVSKAVFAAGALVVHAGINACDTGLLSRHLPGTAFLPNPWNSGSCPEDICQARSWLTSELGDRAPVWLYPARFLRRKNFAEAVLLARWLNPDGWLVTTGA